MKDFDPTQFGATPVDTFDPSQYGAQPYDESKDVNTSAALLGASNTANATHAQMLEQWKADDANGKAAADAMNNPMQILGQTAKNFDQTMTGGIIGDTPGQTVSNALQAGKHAIQGAVQFIGSGARSPIDVVKGAFGYQPDQTPIDVGFGETRPSYQSEFDQSTVPKVQSGEMTPGQATADVVGKTVGGAGDVLLGEGVAKAGLESAATMLDKQAAKQATKTGADALAGKITQGETGDIGAAKSTLGNIDVSKVNSYQDLSKTLGDQVKSDAQLVDQKLANSSVKKSIADWATPVKVGDQTIAHNYVDDALNQLKDFYAKTNDVKNASRISQLIQKGNSEGLSIKDINDIAREHGSTLNAYNANGELSSGLSKQTAENTRMGLKETVRDAYGDPELKALDKKISDTINTKDLIDKQSEAVQKLQNKIQERGFGEKVGRLAGKVINALSGGSAKGLVESFLSRGTGLKTLNALDLQEGLQSNLKALQSALKPGASESDVAKSLQSIVDFLDKPRVNIDKPIRGVIEGVNSLPNQEGGFAKVPSFKSTPMSEPMVGPLKKSDNQLLSRFITTARSKGKMANMTEKEMSYVEDMLTKTGANLDWSMTKLANHAQDLIEGTKDATALYKTGRSFK